MPVTEEDLAVDRELAEISGLLPLLRYITPINVPEQREAFSIEPSEPEFEYLPLPDLTEVARRLDDVDPGRANDPLVAHISRDKKRELEQRLELLDARNTDRFFLAAVEVYGHVEEWLVDLALDLLTIEPAPISSNRLSAEEFAQAARLEIEHYRGHHPELAAIVVVSPTTAGIRVENGDLYIGIDVTVSLDMVEPLLHHEVGVHILTYANGSAQPLHVMAAGLAGYDENQEALGVLAEFLSGGLAVSRLRTLAYRAVAANLRSNQATFVETVDELRRLGAGQRSAFTVAMRAHRAGGIPKDAGYLRGLVRLLDHLADGGAIEPLLVGKVTLEDGPLITELLDRKVLTPPPLTPRWLGTDVSRPLIAKVRDGATVRDLGGLVS